ncbi:hypothetical protein [Phenylobacterium kunshanense]|uniref:Uncharacterized protein n=1 Tax=Phenylobacterium kunshanense TaxID=1445034 RepID=A0A328BRF5_9CAUL|nr:hypothetical protein [Phenylobacterium kunshanense]RAK68596.1 hypothetical protein DJ019_00800 [Phenylobacterium kunshanense]
METQTWHGLAMIIGVGITVVILGLAAVVLWKIFDGTIKLDDLISEDGKASLSRFQFLIFTFVVAGVFLLLSIESGTFVDLPNNVLVLLGLSSGSYVISKGIAENASRNRDRDPEATDPRDAPRPRTRRTRS